MSGFSQEQVEAWFAIESAMERARQAEAPDEIDLSEVVCPGCEAKPKRLKVSWDQEGIKFECGEGHVFRYQEIR